MAVIPTDRRHERAVSRLTDALRKPKIEALLKAWLSALDDLEAEIEGFAVGMTSIDDAVGAQLQVLARIVGSQEVGDDALQRLLVRTRILVVRSSGTGDDLLRILNQITETPELTEYFPATILAGTMHEVTEEEARVAFGFLNAARSAGVRLGLLWTTGAEPDVFTLADTDDPILDNPDAMQLEQLDAAVQSATPGATPTIAWFGALEDVVSGELLTATGDALDEQPAGSPARAIARLCLQYTPASDQYHQADAGVGEIQDAVDWSLIVIFWLPEVVAGGRGLVGKQDLFGVSPFEGWNLFFPGGGGFGAGDLMFELFPTVGSTTQLTAAGACVEGYNVAVMSVNRTTEIASYSVNGGAPQTTSTAGLSYVNAQPLTIGDSRVNRTDPAPLARVPVVAFYDVALDTQAVGLAVLDALHGEAQVDAARGLADDAQTQGGQLLDVRGP